MPRHTNLTVWNRARELVRLVANATREKKSEGDLVAQMRRAAISVAANVAEGAERHSDRDFLRFLKIADGSNSEVMALATIAGDAGILDPDQVAAITACADSIGRMLNGLMRRCAG